MNHSVPPPGALGSMEAAGRWKRPLRRNANIIGAGLLAKFALIFVLFYLLRFLYQGLEQWVFTYEQESLLDEAVELVMYAAAFIVPVVLMVKLLRIPVRIAFPLRRPDFGMLRHAVFLCLGISYGGSILAQFICIGIEAFTGYVPTMSDMDPPVGLAATVVYCISMSVCPAVLEELMYRGVIMQSLRRFGDGFALVVSAVLFGIGHGNMRQAPGALLAGLAIGYFVLRTGSLLTGMIIHFVNNALVVVSSLAYLYLPPETAYTIDMVLILIYIVGAVWGLIELLRRYKGMFRVNPSRCPLSAGVKYGLYATSALTILYLVQIGYTFSTSFERAVPL